MIKILLLVGIFSFIFMLKENITNFLKDRERYNPLVNSISIAPDWSGFHGDLLVAVKEKSCLSWKKIACRMGISDAKLRKFKNHQKYTPIPFFDAIHFVSRAIWIIIVHRYFLTRATILCANIAFEIN